MKKKLALLIVGSLLMMSLAACGGEGETNTNDTDSSSSVSDSNIEESSTTETVETLTLADIVVEDYVTVENYKGLEISYSAKETFTQEDVDALAISAYQGYVTSELGGVKDRAAQLGDLVNIDYVGVMDGVAFDGGSASGASLELGSGSFIDGFEDGLVGVMPGETVDLNISFPDPYDNNPDFAGKPVTFTVTVNFIYPNAIEDMQDEVLAALDYEEYTNVEEFRAFCLEYFEYTTEENYKVGMQNAALNALLEVATVLEAPAGLVQNYYDSAYQSIAMQAAQYGLDAETFSYYFFGGDATTVATMIASENAKSAILLQYIANVENLNVDDAELDVLIEEFAKENDSTVEEVTGNADRELLREYFMNEKVFDFLLANGNCTEVPVE